jgi:hypothetical protein
MGNRFSWHLHWLLIAATVAPVPKEQAPLPKAWYSLRELLVALAEHDGIRSAMPERLAGRAYAGGALSYQAALDEACQQWRLATLALPTR